MAAAPLPGCGGTAVPDLHTYDPSTAAQKAIEAYDRDNDGQLSAAEIEGSPALAASRQRLDRDRDGALTMDEIRARMEELEAGPDFIGMDITLTYKNRPLAGAELTLVPEPFMGEGLQSYKGTSSGGGGCRLEGENKQVPGIPAGLYQAKVVHAEQGINEVVGCEIADDTTGNRLVISL